MVWQGGSLTKQEQKVEEQVKRRESEILASLSHPMATV